MGFGLKGNGEGRRREGVYLCGAFLRKLYAVCGMRGSLIKGCVDGCEARRGALVDEWVGEEKLGRGIRERCQVEGRKASLKYSRYQSQSQEPLSLCRALETRSEQERGRVYMF